MEDDKIKKSHAIVPVYKFVSTSIESFDMFGVNKKPEKRERILIRKMPNLANIRDTGYTYIYFSGANTSINQGYLLTLVGNFRRSTRTVYFYIDRNNNFDFTDDGPPDSLKHGESKLEIHLTNLENKEAEHVVRLSRIPYGKNLGYKSLLTEHFKKNSGDKIFTNINYCYREQRLNTITGSHISETDSFRIAVKDMNVDGLFNESCKDRFYIGGLNDDIMTEDMLEIQPNYERTIFEWNRKQYKLINIDPSGQYVDIEQVESPKLTKKLEMGKSVDDFAFVNIRNQREDLSDYKKREVYLYFWSLGTLDSSQTKYLKLLTTEFADEIQVIALNHGNHPRKVRVYEYYNDIVWKIGYSSVAIGRSFFLESVPTGFYLGKKCKLKQEHLSPEQMYNILKSANEAN